MNIQIDVYMDCPKDLPLTAHMEYGVVFWRCPICAATTAPDGGRETLVHTKTRKRMDLAEAVRLAHVQETENVDAKRNL